MSCERRRTVSLCASPSDLPISLLVHSSAPLPSADCRPGTTRGMLIRGDVVKRRSSMRGRIVILVWWCNLGGYVSPGGGTGVGIYVDNGP